MDISTKALVDTGTFELLDADGDLIQDEKGKACSITVYGPGSKVFQDAKNRHDRASLDALRRKADRTGDRERIAEFLAEVTVSLNNFEYKGGSDRKAIRAMYADPSILFIADQMNSRLGDMANFTKSAATK